MSRRKLIKKKNNKFLYIGIIGNKKNSLGLFLSYMIYMKYNHPIPQF